MFLRIILLSPIQRVMCLSQEDAEKNNAHRALSRGSKRNTSTSHRDRASFTATQQPANISCRKSHCTHRTHPNPPRTEKRGCLIETACLSAEDSMFCLLAQDSHIIRYGAYCSRGIEGAALVLAAVRLHWRADLMLQL